jgi:hypothetical protein
MKNRCMFKGVGHLERILQHLRIGVDLVKEGRRRKSRNAKSSKLH